MTMIKVAHRIQSKRSNLFVYLSLLTVLFFCLEVSFFTKFSGFYLGDAKEVSSHLKIPFKVFPPLFFWFFIQVLLHVLFTLYVFAQTTLAALVFKWTQDKTEKMGIGLWLVNILTLVLLNQYCYPNSRFAALTEIFLNPPITIILLIGLAVILTVVSIVAVIGWFKLMGSNKYSIWIFSLVVTISGLIYFNVTPRTAEFDAATAAKPNIIIIGIDSLRPDFLGYASAKKISPHLDEFFQQSTVFSQSLTPLARTFSSWSSILTGLYPKISGIRTNLQKGVAVDLADTLPAILRSHGYNTIFATDETRFSQINQRFGFNKIIAPAIGFNDFLIGSLNDFPLSNLLINTRIGKWIFPYNYGNRPAFATYDPNSFLNLLEPTLSQDRTQPLFLAVHFCLTHSPYYWGEGLENSNIVINYAAAVLRVDEQVNDFLKLLAKNKLLEHSIVVVLSDHGEAMELHGDRLTTQSKYVSKQKVLPHFYPDTDDDEPLAIDQSVGHGTDVLGWSQYHTVLAFRLFGLAKNKPFAFHDRVSLLDIKPTLLDFLDLTAQHNSGISLRPVILGHKLSQKRPEHFFTESDFSPAAIRVAHPELRKVLFEGVNYFEIDPITTCFTVKKSMEKMILASKQFADYYGDWVLAFYPQAQHEMTPVLVNLKTGYWTDDLNTQFAQKSPAVHMLQAMHEFYGTDLIKS